MCCGLCCAKERTVSLPSPPVPPVTSITRPLRSGISFAGLKTGFLNILKAMAGEFVLIPLCSVVVFSWSVNLSWNAVSYLLMNFLISSYLV